MTSARPTGRTAHPVHRTATRPGRGTAAAGLAAAVLALGACSPDDPAEINSPGTNLTVNGIAVRYAHLEDPDTPGTGYVAGDDVPLYLWFENESEEPATLTDVSSEIATDVTMSGAELPVDLPVGTLVELGPDDPHFVLEDITQQIRGAEFVPVTLMFSDGSEVEIMVEAIEVGPLD